MDRDRNQWLKEINEDFALIHYFLVHENPPSARDIAMAIKEARRLQSDIYRFARDCYDINREEIDDIKGL